MQEPVIALDARLVGGTNTGDSAYWLGLLQGMCRIGCEWRFLLLSNNDQPSGIPIPSNARWVKVPSKRERWWSLAAFPLKARRLGATVLHTQYNLSPLAGRHGVTTIHDVSFMVGPEWFLPMDRVLLQRMVPMSARLAKKVITVSETSKEDIERFIPAARGKVRVTPNAAPSDLKPMAMEGARRIVEGELGLDKPFLLTVGTRWPRKNMALAIEVAERLPKSFPHVLALTGKPGWGEENLGERCRPLGYVSTQQLRALYSVAALYLAPSWYEGFGITLLEAFQCGCPVVCSPGGAHPEVADQAALVMPGWDADDWLKAVQSLLADSSNLDAMRTAGYARAAKFDWAQTASLTCDVYREVLE